MPVTRTETMLSSSLSRTKYLEAEIAKNREVISTFLYARFHERYILPFDGNIQKNGFIMMAAACLMIEAMESFWQGWKKSPNSALAFCQFFDRNQRFEVMRGHAQGFYANVRCGIMHQGETTGGWHIRRDLSTLFDAGSLTLDATKFLQELAACLADYRDLLARSPWDATVWKNFRTKMKAVCNNTEA